MPFCYTVFALNFFHLLARKPNLEKISIYSDKFFYNFHLSESSFTCPALRASGLVRILTIYVTENELMSVVLRPLIKHPDPGPLLFLFDTLQLASMNNIYSIDNLLIDFHCVYCKQIFSFIFVRKKILQEMRSTHYYFI